MNRNCNKIEVTPESCLDLRPNKNSEKFGKSPIKTKAELITLLENLFQLTNEKDVVFRGVCDSSFKLEPRALRKVNLADARRNYPIKPSEIQTLWFQNRDLIEQVKIIAKDPSARILIDQKNSSSLSITSIERIYNLVLDIMCYHHFYNEFLERNPEYLSVMERQAYPEKWTDIQTFNFIVIRILESIVAKYGEGDVLQYSYIPPERSGFEETFPQHYGFPSAVLDWSTDPYVALYFATKEYWEEVFGGLIRATHPPTTKWFSIFSYQQLCNVAQVPVNMWIQLNWIKTLGHNANMGNLLICRRLIVFISNMVNTLHLKITLILGYFL